MSDQLFIEVSVEQQATVTGGVDLSATFTSFFGSQTILASGASSGPGGSTASGGLSSTTILTTGSNLTVTGLPSLPPPPPPGPGPVPVNP
ncbi:MAG TPA: CTB family bacteriocin [Nodularia sp. (in: cyanobacteria)]|nr:CTB family bacteriocin [Nodularia sp. (in: cyanobacteria)]